MEFLKGVVASLCTVSVIYLNPQEDMTLARRPHGDCLWCCPVKLERDIRLLLYTRHSPDRGALVPLTDPGPALLQGLANPANPTVLYIHGFVERAPSYSTSFIKDDPQEDMTLARRPHGDCLWCCPVKLERDIRLLLYTRHSPDRGALVPLTDPGPALLQGLANPANPTVLYIHGFVERAPSYSTSFIKDDPQEDMTLARRPHGDCLWCCPVKLERDIRLLLYTRHSPDRGALVPLTDPGPALLQGLANPVNPTVMYIHGFVERAPSYSTSFIKDAYLSTGDYNVLLVDWSSLSAGPWYVAAVRNTRKVGKVLAQFLLQADAAGMLPLNLVHVIGFSLGAEIAGFAGKAMPEDRRIPRITGLDPAFPLYYGGRQYHLASGDADFVDVIHTDAGILGYPTPIGDVDFYPNGGRTFQPGCLLHSNIMSNIVGCSHLRAWRYYAESVRNPYGFPATKCARWRGLLPPCRFTTDNYMGVMASPESKGRFYLETNEKEPFAKNGPITGGIQGNSIFRFS